MHLPAALLVCAAVVAGCLSASPDDAGPAAQEKLLGQAWTSALQPVEPPVAVTAGVVFHALSTQRRFEVVSVAAEDGRVRWRTDASPSRIDHGVGLRVQTLEGGRTVLWMAPGRTFRDGDVSLLAADAVTGARRWSYGDGQLRLRSAPSTCRSGSAVCLVAYRSASPSPRSVVLEAASGRVLSDEPAPFTGEVRSIGEELYEAGGVLARVDDRGRVVWHRRVSDAFGAQVDPDFGWKIRLAAGRYVGSLGRVRPSTGSPAARLQVQDLAATAALDAATGRTLWIRPKSSVFCGQLEFDPDSPVVCDSTGETSADGSPVAELDVTLAGIDPASGKDRWRARVGAVRGLLRDGDDVVRVGETAYILRTAEGLLRLDLDRGVDRAPRDEDAGWCTAEFSVAPVEDVEGVNPDGVTQYAVDHWYPCRVGGAALDRPKQTATFAGATVDGVFAYTGKDGMLRAVRTD